MSTNDNPVIKMLQPSALFKTLGIEGVDEPGKVLELIFGFLAYMKVGDKLNSSDMSLTKISEDLIHLDSQINMPQVVDSLEKKKIICFPI